MPVNEFLVLWLSSWAAIAFFRIAPAFALRGRTLSSRVTEALGYIPPAAFAALVANDLISPGAFDAGLWQGLIPWIAAAGVVAVAIKTKSMPMVLRLGHRALYRFEPRIRAGRVIIPANESNFSPRRSASSGTMVKLYCSKA